MPFSQQEAMEYVYCVLNKNANIGCFFAGFRPFFKVTVKGFYLTLFSVHRMTICNLYTMPRMPEPVWLTMMSGALKKNQLCGHFMRELSLLMEQASKNQLSTFNKT